LAVVREGETIHIDLNARRIDLQADDVEDRVRKWTPAKRNLKPGWLAIYSEIVQPIQSGAVLGKRAKPGDKAVRE
jgi:dihydroxy-acid dehydratase